jgi:hypothetical protein
MNELTTKFWRLEELCSWLEGLGVRIYDLLLGPPSSQARWADQLDEATGRLEVELAERRQVDAELEALWLLLHLFKTWYWVMSMVPLHWWHPYPWWWSCSKVGLTLRLPMESAGGPDLCWL